MNQTVTLVLIQKTLSGDIQSLENLIKMYQNYIYNLCRSMFLNPMDAEDVTQEILLKLVSNLAKYDSNKAKFSTWLYRITINHVISTKKKRLEEVTSDFEAYGKELDGIPFQEMMREELERPETKLLIEEAKIGCSMGMLLCLDRNQRIVFVMGEIMHLSHRTAAEILEITPDHYRKKLSRARKDLFQFMEDKCGLINRNNPCRCEKKTMGFINAGWVDKSNLKFANFHFQRIREIAESLECIEDDFHRKGYDDLYQDYPFHPAPKQMLDHILSRLEPEFLKIP